MWLKPWHTARAYFSPGICIASLYHPITCWKKEGKQWTKIVHRAEKHTSVPPGKEILQVLSIYFLHFWQWKSAWADAKSARIWLHSPCFCYFSWHVLWGGKCQTSLKFVTMTWFALGCSVWTSPGPCEAMTSWVILVGLSISALCKGAGGCSSSQCWWGVINSICVQSHTGISFKLSFKPFTATTTKQLQLMPCPLLGHCGSLMPGAPCRSWLWLPQPVPHPSREL